MFFIMFLITIIIGVVIGQAIYDILKKVTFRILNKKFEKVSYGTK